MSIGTRIDRLLGFDQGSIDSGLRPYVRTGSEASEADDTPTRRPAVLVKDQAPPSLLHVTVV